MSKHRTIWKYFDKGDQGTFIRVGYVRNSKDCHHEGYPLDFIRLQIRSHWEGQEDIDILVRLDEAASLAAGFSKVVGDMLAGKFGKKDVAAHALAVKKKDL